MSGEDVVVLTGTFSGCSCSVAAVGMVVSAGLVMVAVGVTGPAGSAALYSSCCVAGVDLVWSTFVLVSGGVVAASVVDAVACSTVFDCDSKSGASMVSAGVLPPSYSTHCMWREGSRVRRCRWVRVRIVGVVWRRMVLIRIRVWVSLRGRPVLTVWERLCRRGWCRGRRFTVGVCCRCRRCCRIVFVVWFLRCRGVKPFGWLALRTRRCRVVRCMVVFVVIGVWRIV